MKGKKGRALLLMLSLFFGCVAGCEKGQELPEPTGISTSTQETEITVTPVPMPTSEPVRNLKGLRIVIGDTYSPEVTPVPMSAQEEATRLYREDIMQTHNCTIEAKKVADWDEMQEVYISSVEEGEPVAQVFELDYRFIAKPLSMGLFYDLAAL